MALGLGHSYDWVTRDYSGWGLSPRLELLMSAVLVGFIIIIIWCLENMEKSRKADKKELNARLDELERLQYEQAPA